MNTRLLAPACGALGAALVIALSAGLVTVAYAGTTDVNQNSQSSMNASGRGGRQAMNRPWMGRRWMNRSNAGRWQSPCGCRAMDDGRMMRNDRPMMVRAMPWRENRRDMGNRSMINGTWWGSDFRAEQPSPAPASFASGTMESHVEVPGGIDVIYTGPDLAAIDTMLQQRSRADGGPASKSGTTTSVIDNGQCVDFTIRGWEANAIADGLIGPPPAD